MHQERLGQHWVVLRVGEREVIDLGGEAAEHVEDLVARSGGERRGVARPDAVGGPVAAAVEAGRRDEHPGPGGRLPRVGELDGTPGPRERSLEQLTTAGEQHLGLHRPAVPGAGGAVAGGHPRLDHVEHGVRRGGVRGVVVEGTDGHHVDRLRG